jgi:hypothetical protein
MRAEKPSALKAFNNWHQNVWLRLVFVKEFLEPEIPGL